MSAHAASPPVARFRVPLPFARRSVLAAVAGLAGAALLPRRLRAAPDTEIRLVAAPGRVPLVGPPHPDTPVWCYDGRVPGPEIRVRQGERLRVLVENRLDEETTVHWHGVRLPNAMDGVPHLTQAPIAPGEIFAYEFDCPDAGTFWYHPHHRSFEQVGRGLAGALVVEERAPVAVDRDVVWVLSDWRMLQDASIRDDFGDMHDVSHAGRLGNTVTVNGRVIETFAVRAGERLRLRLVNAANARIFGLAFEGHAPQVIALDGQPVEPHAPEDGRIVLGPAMRADLVLDLTGKPGQRTRVLDTNYPGSEYRLLDLVYADDPPLRAPPPALPIRLPANPLAEPDLAAAERHEIALGGGMMGSMRSALVDGRPADLRAMMHDGLAWAINGVAAKGHVLEPLLTLQRGRSYVLALANDTAWHHPMHLHGHAFRVVGRNGQPTRHREWQDTVLVPARERAEIAFVADNPGDWMFHCHVLEHQAGGMTAVVRVA
jgi:FtsP/CotA-like multicopper oxidase with cupredoxin domain